MSLFKHLKSTRSGIEIDCEKAGMKGGLPSETRGRDCSRMAIRDTLESRSIESALISESKKAPCPFSYKEDEGPMKEGHSELTKRDKISQVPFAQMVNRRKHCPQIFSFACQFSLKDSSDPRGDHSF